MQPVFVQSGCVLNPMPPADDIRHSAKRHTTADADCIFSSFAGFNWPFISLMQSVVVQLADVLALAGDAADNIPGVKGVGIKTAPKLLQQFGDLETLLARADEVEKKVRPSRHP